ncbi:hypothetical protein STEG23_004234, partial [Scotinomys teguina]
AKNMVHKRKKLGQQQVWSGASLSLGDKLCTLWMAKLEKPAVSRSSGAQKIVDASGISCLYLTGSVSFIEQVDPRVLSLPLIVGTIIRESTGSTGDLANQLTQVSLKFAKTVNIDAANCGIMELSSEGPELLTAMETA